MTAEQRDWVQQKTISLREWGSCRVAVLAGQPADFAHGFELQYRPAGDGSAVRAPLVFAVSR